MALGYAALAMPLGAAYADLQQRPPQVVIMQNACVVYYRKGENVTRGGFYDWAVSIRNGGRERLFLSSKGTVEKQEVSAAAMRHTTPTNASSSIQP